MLVERKYRNKIDQKTILRKKNIENKIPKENYRKRYFKIILLEKFLIKKKNQNKENLKKRVHFDFVCFL